MGGSQDLRYHSLVVLSKSVSNNPKCPDSEWRERLRIIQDADMRSFGVTTVPATGFKVVRRGLKRARMAIVPEVVTFRADEVSE